MFSWMLLRGNDCRKRKKDVTVTQAAKKEAKDIKEIYDHLILIQDRVIIFLPTPSDESLMPLYLETLHR